MNEIFHYIKMGVGNDGYIDLQSELAEGQYNNIGTTVEDYYAGRFVLLTEEQYLFHLEHPEADKYEVMNMELRPPYEPTEAELLAVLKEQKMQEIEQYSHSSAVDQFTINGVIEGWLTPAERSNYLQSLTSAELLGERDVDFFVGKHFFTLDLHSARLVLAKIQRYADASFIVTERKKLELDALQTVDEVKAFDVTSGYPEPLNFDFITEDDTDEDNKQQESNSSLNEEGSINEEEHNEE